MPHHLSIINAGEFIRSDPHGTIDIHETRRVLTSLAGALVQRGVDKAVLDLRKLRIEPQLSYTQLYELARTFQEAGFGTRHRLALLVAPNKYDKAEFFAICASGRGWNCFAFDSFEEALDWLSETTELPAP